MPSMRENAHPTKGNDSSLEVGKDESSKPFDQLAKFVSLLSKKVPFVEDK